MILDSVKCDKCGHLHDADAETFYTVKGNVMLGLSGGMIGNNLDEQDKVVREMHYCRNPCMWQVLRCPTGVDRRELAATGGHAENCASMRSQGAVCDCAGGNYVWGRRGPRQLGEYDG